MRKLPLSHNRFALVDDEDYLKVSQYNWHLTGAGYVIRNRKQRNRVVVDNEPVYLHRMVMRPPIGKYVDHRNHDPLDNRKANLRVCTPQQSAANMRSPRYNTTGYKGIYKRPTKTVETYQTYIRHYDKHIYVGAFRDPAEAAYVYDQVALQLKGEFAYLNTPFDEGRRPTV